MVLMENRENVEKISNILTSLNDLSTLDLSNILDYLTNLIEYKKLKIELIRQSNILKNG